MSKISWPNAASRCPTKRSGCGASRSVQHTLAGSSVDRAGWATLGTWTRSFVTIQGRRHYIWRAVDQDGDVIDILVQSHRDCRAATRFFRKLLKGQEHQPVRLVTDKLSSYRAAHRAVMPSVAHRTDRYEKQPRRGFASTDATARATDAPVQNPLRTRSGFSRSTGLVLNLFRVGRHLLRSAHQRLLRMRAFAEWDAVTCAC